MWGMGELQFWHFQRMRFPFEDGCSQTKLHVSAFFFLSRLFLLEPLDFPPMTHMYRNRQRHKVKTLAFAFMAGKIYPPRCIS